MFGETPTCPEGQYYNPLTGGCELVIDEDKIHPCPQGQHTDPITYACKPNDGSVVVVKASMGPVAWGGIAAGIILVAAAIVARVRPAAAPSRASKRRRR